MRDGIYKIILILVLIGIIEINVAMAETGSQQVMIVNDTYVDYYRFDTSYQNSNYGSSTYFMTAACCNYGDYEAYSLLKANITGYYNSVIKNATLYLYNTGNMNQVVNVYEIDNSWDEFVVNWTNQPSHSNFSGQYGIPVTYGWNSVDITVPLRKWLNGSIQNYGIMLTTVAWASGNIFESREGTNNHPYVNFTYDNVSFIFDEKTISESQIYQGIQPVLISVNISDPDGNIVSASVGVVYGGNQTNYSLVRVGNYWSYSFSTNNPGVYTVAKYYATDDSYGSNSSSGSLNFTVVPIQGSSAPSVPGSGPVVILTPTPTPTDTIQQNTVNINTMSQDPIGQLILYGMAIIGGILIFLGIRKDGTVKTILIGVMMILGSIAILGWV